MISLHEMRFATSDKSCGGGPEISPQLVLPM